MTTETPCRVRDGVSFLEPTTNEREPLQVCGVHTLGLAKGFTLSSSNGFTLSHSKGSLKRMRGTHLRGQVHKEPPTRHRGGEFAPFRSPAAAPVPLSRRV